MRKIIPEEHEEVYEPEHLPVQDYKTANVKPKRQISDAQREHLNKIRELAMKKKAELKEITLKSKLAKTVPKQALAKQYDEYIERMHSQAHASEQKVKQQTKKKEVKEVEPSGSKKSSTFEEEEVEEEVVVKAKPKKRIVKKIVYKSESEEEEEEEVIVRKSKPKAKTQSLEHLVYNSNRDQLYNRMIEERVKNSIIGYGNALGV
jgi:hypothetical protein